MPRGWTCRETGVRRSLRLGCFLHLLRRLRSTCSAAMSRRHRLESSDDVVHAAHVSRTAEGRGGVPAERKVVHAGVHVAVYFFYNNAPPPPH